LADFYIWHIVYELNLQQNNY